jgi:hypothetical protein
MKKPGLKGWIMHYTNPAHVMCRLIDIIVLYDYYYAKVFNTGNHIKTSHIYKAIVNRRKSVYEKLEKDMLQD